MSNNDFAYASTPLPTDIAVTNASGADIAVGDVVKLDTSHPLSSSQQWPGVTATTTDDYPFGVAMTSIPNGKQGLVRRQGIAQVVAQASITAGDVVSCSTSSKVKTTPGGKAQLGQALLGATSDGDKITVALDIAKNS